MNTLYSAIAAVLLSSLFFALVMWIRRRSAGANSRADAEQRLDVVEAWPPEAVRVMTAPERQALDLLRRALPGYLVLSQVPLQRFIRVPTRHSYSLWLHKVGRQTADLLVCDFSSRVIAAIEIQPPQPTDASLERHKRKAQVLKAAGVAVFVWNEAALPSASKVRELFIAKLDLNDLADADSPAPTTPGALAPASPATAMQELLEVGDAIEYGQQEPVPSGFFDDLEAAVPPA
ncbi:MAG TPA: DUF2726 domain-containing protein [Burkholderiaceae bacterium]|nr:DUF2726 domain-containing protein [Burkholderiaceae bacterium]